MAINSTITTQGAALLAAAHAGDKLHFTRIAVGSGTITGDLAGYTGLINEVYRFPVTKITRKDNDAWVLAQVDASGTDADYALTEIGLYAADINDPGNREADILYAVCTASGNDLFAYITLDAQANNQWDITVHAVASAAEDITVNVVHELIGDGDTVTQEDLERYTPLDVFQPLDKDGVWYGEHRHDASTIDGLGDTGWKVGDIRTASYHLPEDPEGDYMLCDGRQIDLLNYPELRDRWDYPMAPSDIDEGGVECLLKQNNALDPTLESFCWSPELQIFVAVGIDNISGNGCIYSSANSAPYAARWTLRFLTSYEAEPFYDVCWSAAWGKFIAVAELSGHGVFYTSADGINWTCGYVIPEQIRLTRIYAFDAMAIAVGIVEGKDRPIYRTTNGSTWSRIGSAPAYTGVSDIVYASHLGLYIIMGGSSRLGNAQLVGVNPVHMYYSSDCATWTQGTTPNEWPIFHSIDESLTHTIAYSPVKKLLVASVYAHYQSEIRGARVDSRITVPGFLTSVDGKNWVNSTMTDQADSAVNVGSVCWSDYYNKFLSIGNRAIFGWPGESYPSYRYSGVSLSNDGLTWTHYRIPLNTKGSGVPQLLWCDSAGKYVVRGFCDVPYNDLHSLTHQPFDNSFAVSYDGINWEAGGSLPNEIGCVRALCACAAPSGTRYLAVGSTVWDNYNGINYAIRNRYLKSDDGVKWDSENDLRWTTDAEANDQIHFECICWSQELGLSIAGGRTRVDGSVKSQGVLYYSMDAGVSWVKALITPGLGTFFSVCWSPELRIFVAVGSYVYTSSDGIVWVARTSPPRTIDSVIWCAERSQFIGVGGKSSYTGGSCIFNVYTSPDGREWTEVSTTINGAGRDGSVTNGSGASYWLRYASSPGMFLAISRNGLARTSADLINWTENSIDSRPDSDIYSIQVYSVDWSPSSGIFLAGGGSPIAFYSSVDGQNWVKQYTGKDGIIYAIIWSETLGRFIAAGRIAGAGKDARIIGYYPVFYTAEYTGGAVETTLACLPTYSNDMPFTFLKVK
ncbi:MAG: phage tail protein [Clostridiales bacterium]|jgi:hypothetical protein|nr:phage tail protein [Clostridiales bacterium]